MLIHFICTGNAYRSRLAEAYLNSKQLKDMSAFSSGTRAEQNKCINGPIDWYAQRIIEKYNLVPFESFNPQNTSKELLIKGDFTIFMKQEHYDFCRSSFGFNNSNYEIWRIDDMKDADEITRSDNAEDDMQAIKVSEETFNKIKEKVKMLIQKLNL